ncbi:MAG: hypothetical protein E7242_09630 [Lachnospiraceae bacterium]|nr:hypothetical protein [Lachnospiraceae bacterium]
MIKRILRWIFRIAVVAAGLFITFMALGGGRYFIEEADATSSATTVDENIVISGEYMVFINKDLHPDTTDIWTRFFKGGEIPVVLDDLSCMVAEGDENVWAYVDPCIARLPANQMKVKIENPLLLFSKGDSGNFDIIIMTRELADRYDAKTIANNNNIAMVEVS